MRSKLKSEKAASSTRGAVPSGSKSKQPLKRLAPRTQAERREESVARMLRAGMKLFAKGGVAGTTLADIGLAAGYSRGLPVYAFGSKDKFLIAMLRSMEVWFEQLAHDQLMGKTGLAAFRSRLDTHFIGLRKDPVAIAALFSIFSSSFFGDGALKAEVDRLVEQWRRGFSRHLKEAYHAGEIKKVDFDKHAALCVLLVRGVNMEYLMSDSKLDLDSLQNSILDFFEHSLQTNDARSKRS
jgi:AcrR family transcriptional regulator